MQKPHCAPPVRSRRPERMRSAALGHSSMVVWPVHRGAQGPARCRPDRWPDHHRAGAAVSPVAALLGAVRPSRNATPRARWCSGSRALTLLPVHQRRQTTVSEAFRGSPMSADGAPSGSPKSRHARCGDYTRSVCLSGRPSRSPLRPEPVPPPSRRAPSDKDFDPPHGAQDTRRIRRTSAALASGNTDASIAWSGPACSRRRAATPPVPPFSTGPGPPASTRPRFTNPRRRGRGGRPRPRCRRQHPWLGLTPPAPCSGLTEARRGCCDLRDSRGSRSATPTSARPSTPSSSRRPPCARAGVARSSSRGITSR